MFHICVERFDVTNIVGKILGTKRGLCRAQWHQCGKSLLHLVPAPGDAWAHRPERRDGCPFSAGALRVGCKC